MPLDPEARDERAQEEGYESWEAWVAAVAEEKGHDVCGEPTVQEPVRPCSRSEAWGVDDASEGPCTTHIDSEASKRHAVKEKYLELVRSGEYTLQGAARVAGVDRSTLDKWADTDREFAAEKRDAEVRRAQRRLENLDDIMYREAIQGEAKGSERIFLTKVYAASIRRRGVEPPLDYDQPDRLELSTGEGVESAREELERKLDAVRERLLGPESGGEAGEGSEAAGEVPG